MAEAAIQMRKSESTSGGSEDTREQYPASVSNSSVYFFLMSMPKGHKIQRHKLHYRSANRFYNDDQVIKMKIALNNRGKKSIKEVAAEMNISYPILRAIASGAVYASVSIK